MPGPLRLSTSLFRRENSGGEICAEILSHAAIEWLRHENQSQGYGLHRAGDVWVEARKEPHLLAATETVVCGQSE